MELPALELDETPFRHAHCCLTLSATLFNVLTETCLAGESSPRTILSIGSGTGLLEALWQKHLTGLNLLPHQVEGVEVQQSAARGAVNIYLPEQAFTEVRTTNDVSSRALEPEVSTAVFVYPRQPRLVSEYVQNLRDDNGTLKSLIWLGPVVDWADFSNCFDTKGTASCMFELRVLPGEEAGVGDYEMMAALRKISR